MKKEFIGKVAAIVAILALVVFPLGYTITVFSMFFGFQEITLVGPSVDPASSAGFNFGRLTTITGLIALVSGLVLLVFSATALNYRAKWVFWCSLFVSIWMLLIIPIGTIIGLVGLAALFLTRDEFASNAAVT